MGRLLVIALLVVLGYRLLIGRWPWQSKAAMHERRLADARRLLGLPANATRHDVQVAHRRSLAAVHPDRGGSNAQVHEVNAARDLLLAHLPYDSKERA